MKLLSFLLVLLLQSNWSNSQSGSIDYSFGTDFDCEINSTMKPVGIQRNGKIIVGGDFRIKFVNSNKLDGLARLNQDGSLDFSFNNGRGLHGISNFISVLPDDRILVSGYFEQYNGSSAFGLVLLNPDGSRDSSFHASYFTNPTSICETAICKNKILVFGRQGTSSVLFRINLDGSFDSSFQKVKVPSFCAPKVLEVLPNGEIYFLVVDELSVWHLLKIKSNGLVDSSFQMDNNITIGYLTYMEQFDDGKLLLIGNLFSKKDVRLTRVLILNKDGTIYNSFTLDEKFDKLENCLINTSHIQKNNKIILGGLFIGLLGGKERISVIRLNINGGIDTTFLITKEGFNNSIQNIEKYGESSLIVTGKFESYGPFLTSRIAKINVENDAEPFKFNIYPNSNQGSFWIEANQSLKGITIYDSVGNEILRREVDSPDIQIDITNKANGVYFINCLSETGNKTLRMLKL